MEATSVIDAATYRVPTQRNLAGMVITPKLFKMIDIFDSPVLIAIGGRTVQIASESEQTLGSI